MAVLTVLQVDIDGLINPTFDAAAGGGDSFTNDGKNRTFCIIKNASGGSITVTLADTGSVAPAGANAFDADVDIAIPAGEDAYLGPFPTSRFGASIGLTYSGVTSLTVMAFRL